jgi:hypothetical protein
MYTVSLDSFPQMSRCKSQVIVRMAQGFPHCRIHSVTIHIGRSCSVQVVGVFGSLLLSLWEAIGALSFGETGQPRAGMYKIEQDLINGLGRQSFQAAQAQ